MGSMRTLDVAETVENVLRPLPIEERDRLCRLMQSGPALVERLTGYRPARSTLWRWVTRGVAGVKLGNVVVGPSRFISARMLAVHWAQVAAAREAAGLPVKPTKPRKTKRKNPRRLAHSR